RVAPGGAGADRDAELAGGGVLVCDGDRSTVLAYVGIVAHDVMTVRKSRAGYGESRVDDLGFADLAIRNEEVLKCFRESIHVADVPVAVRRDVQRGADSHVASVHRCVVGAASGLAVEDGGAPGVVYLGDAEEVAANAIVEHDADADRTVVHADVIADRFRVA